jgi:hydrogenase-4 component B
MDSLDILLFQFILILSGLLLILPKRMLHTYVLLLVAALAGISSYWAILAITSGEPITRSFFNDFWQDSPKITIDGLSAYFILVVNFTVLTGIVYARGYMQHYLKGKTKLSIALHYFSFAWLHASMLQIVMMREGMAFLLVWELMALSSFVLVIFEGEKKEVMRAGINYLIQMHVGFLFILLGFMTIQQSTGVMSFDALSIYFTEHSNFWLFLVFFIGFGIKAGFIPLHSWLPHAHPAAPSHVSGIMSGVMIKMGIYGILRVLTHVQSDFLEISVFIIIISLASGLLGVILAIYQHDLKKLLAYHSIENIGIIGIGIGVGMFGMVVKNPVLVMLGFSGGILHVLNHSLFKSSLFYAAGSVYQATHTRDVNKLGGLIKSMPITSILFFTSALAICGIPPFNGFISEFLMYSGVFGNLSHAGYGNSLASVAVIIGLALIGGLAVFCFTKVFGVAFLGTARSDYKSQIKEVNKSMWLPGVVILIFMLSIGFFPNVYVQSVMSVLQSFHFLKIDNSYLPILSGTMASIGKANMIFAGIAIVLILLKKWQQKKVQVATGPTWGCGYTGGDFKHQYTSTSYANNLRESVAPLISYKRDYKSFETEEIFPGERIFKTHVEDRIEQKLLMKPITAFINWLPKAGLAQTGKIHHYLQYPIWFIILLGLLTFFNII